MTVSTSPHQALYAFFQRLLRVEISRSQDLEEALLQISRFPSLLLEGIQGGRQTAVERGHSTLDREERLSRLGVVRE